MTHNDTYIIHAQARTQYKAPNRTNNHDPTLANINTQLSLTKLMQRITQTMLDMIMFVKRIMKNKIPPKWMMHAVQMWFYTSITTATSIANDMIDVDKDHGAWRLR